MSKQNIKTGFKYGIVGGLVATIIDDIISLIIFIAMGQSFPAFFALIGSTFLTFIGSEAVFPAWQGLTLHYSIGILTGLVLGLLTQRFRKLQFSSYRKGILLSIIIIQVEGNVLFYLMSVIMNIPQSEMVMIYALGFVLHLIWGTCFGLMLTYGQRRGVSVRMGARL
jgi:hypothetical protein